MVHMNQVVERESREKDSEFRYNVLGSKPIAHVRRHHGGSSFRTLEFVTTISVMII
jgi:hypothetical protein